MFPELKWDKIKRIQEFKHVFSLMFIYTLRKSLEILHVDRKKMIYNKIIQFNSVL